MGVKLIFENRRVQVVTCNKAASVQVFGFAVYPFVELQQYSHNPREWGASTLSLDLTRHEYNFNSAT